MAHLIQSSEVGPSGQGAPGLSSKGSAKRERLLAELAERNGSFMLPVAQQGFRRMYPSENVPRTLDEFRAEPRRFTFGQYLERYGGYGAQRELGLTMHMTTQIADVLLSGETDAALDLLALMMTCLEQVCQDGGKWEVGYTLSLFPEPAHQVFSSRGSPQNPRLRAWAPLCPAPWATTALAFLKEADNIIARRHEASGSATSSGKPPDTDPAAKKPPKKPSFPRKPKAE